MRVARHVRVTGLVQGVFFRVWTKKQAERLGIAGWVRNCADGSVEAHLEGDEDAVQRLLAELRQGPSGASVERLDVDGAAVSAADSFEVRH